MSADDKPPELSEKLLALLTAAVAYLNRRRPDAPSLTPRQLIQRNTVTLIRAYVEAEEQLERAAQSHPPSSSPPLS